MKETTDQIHRISESQRDNEQLFLYGRQNVETDDIVKVESVTVSALA